MKKQIIGCFVFVVFFVFLAEAQTYHLKGDLDVGIRVGTNVLRIAKARIRSYDSDYEVNTVLQSRLQNLNGGTTLDYGISNRVSLGLNYGVQKRKLKSNSMFDPQFQDSWTLHGVGLRLIAHNLIIKSEAINFYIGGGPVLYIEKRTSTYEVNSGQMHTQLPLRVSPSPIGIQFFGGLDYKISDHFCWNVEFGAGVTTISGGLKYKFFKE